MYMRKATPTELLEFYSGESARKRLDGAMKPTVRFNQKTMNIPLGGGRYPGRINTQKQGKMTMRQLELKIKKNSEALRKGNININIKGQLEDTIKKNSADLYKRTAQSRESIKKNRAVKKRQYHDATRRNNNTQAFDRVTPHRYEEHQNPERPCWSEKVVPMIAFYILICSLLFVTGALDPRKGVGLIMLIFNLVLFCMFAGVVIMRPTWTFIGGCD